ncbi:ribonuclease H-like domain-containing protein, partial [Tanacetum coccineum]
CFEIIGYPNGFKRNQNRKNSSNNKGYSSNNVDVHKNSSGMPFISDQIAKLMSLIRDKPGNGIHANMAGANQHITSSTNNMTNAIDISELNITVGHLNGTTANIRKLVRDSKLHVGFNEYDCIIQDLKRKNILGTGSEVGGLYVFNTEWQCSQASSPNNDGGEPSGSNIGSESESDDTAKEQSSDDDQRPVQIGEEDFSKGIVFENNDVPTNLFNTKESNTLRRSSMQSKLPPKLNDYVLNNKVRYGLYKFANHTWLSVKNGGFIANINMSFEPKSFEEAALDKNWVQAMNEEMEALYENNSWALVELPKNRIAIGSKWREGIDYEETFSPVVKMGTVRCLISLAVQNGWCLFQLDVNNAFLYESGGSFVALLVYVDDIVLTGNDINEINKVKTFLKSKFKIKDLGELKYFLGIEVLKAEKGGLYLSQRKYCLELLHDFGLLACKPVSTPLAENIILAHKESKDDKFLKNITSYQRHVGKLIYLTLTRSDISYSVNCLSQHMQAPLQSHMDLGLRFLKYLKGAPGSGVNYEKSEHMSLKKSKKQSILSKSYTEAEYRSMAAATCEVMWVVNILKDLKVSNLLQAELLCDNSVAIQIAANPVMHEKTKHFDLDVHIIREKVASGLIKIAKIDSEN